MIKSFKTCEEDKIFNQVFSKKFPNNIQRIAMRKLWMLNASFSLNDLMIPPGNRLEKMKGDKKSLYSIRINEQWRICFLWSDGDAYNVEIIDYH